MGYGVGWMEEPPDVVSIVLIDHTSTSLPLLSVTVEMVN